MKVMVTGGSGRLGGYVLRELKQAGHTVASFSRTPPLVEGAAFLPGDVLKPESLSAACRGQDAIVHLAAVPHPKRATAERLREVNVLGTYNVLDAAVAADVGKVVFASSGAALGFTFQAREMIPRYFPVDEEHASEPQDEYGLSKLLGELIAKSYSETYGLKTLCLRINANWTLDREGAALAGRSGAFQSAPLTVAQIWESYRLQLEHPDGPFSVPGPPPPRHNLWMYTDARDGAQALRLAVENKDILHDVFLVTADDTWAMVETPELLRRYYPGVETRQPLVGYNSVVSAAKAKRLLGYRPQYTWRKGEFAEWLASRSARP